MKDKYYELDKSVSEQIMKEFKGKTTEVVCPDCKGKKCEHCQQKGSVVYEW